MNPIILISFILGIVIFLVCLIVCLLSKDDDFGIVAFLSLFLILPMGFALSDQWEKTHKQPSVSITNTNQVENPQ